MVSHRLLVIDLTVFLFTRSYVNIPHEKRFCNLLIVLFEIPSKGKMPGQVMKSKSYELRYVLFVMELFDMKHKNE
jgi:hypothetical protein